jgi:hypothetical protein
MVQLEHKHKPTKRPTLQDKKESLGESEHRQKCQSVERIPAVITTIALLVRSITLVDGVPQPKSVCLEAPVAQALALVRLRASGRGSLLIVMHAIIKTRVRHVDRKSDLPAQSVCGAPEQALATPGTC